MDPLDFLLAQLPGGLVLARVEVDTYDKETRTGTI